VQVHFQAPSPPNFKAADKENMCQSETGLKHRHFDNNVRMAWHLPLSWDEPGRYMHDFGDEIREWRGYPNFDLCFRSAEGRVLLMEAKKANARFRKSPNGSNMLGEKLDSWRDNFAAKSKSAANRWLLERRERRSSRNPQPPLSASERDSWLTREKLPTDFVYVVPSLTSTQWDDICAWFRIDKNGCHFRRVEVWRLHSPVELKRAETEGSVAWVHVVPGFPRAD
jgi:hypothetical protein